MKGAFDASAGFGWTGADGQHEKVPIVEFDFEQVFRTSDGESDEESDEEGLEEEAARVPLAEVLSPRERVCAFVVAREILRRASPRAQSARRAWRDPAIRRRRSQGMRRGWQNPVIRQRMVEGMRRVGRSPERRAALRKRWQNPSKRQRMLETMRRAFDSPESRRKLLDWWSSGAREMMRETSRKRWRERREELLAGMRSPEYRRKRSDLARARWADPVCRNRLLAVLRSPEARQRKSLGMRRYFQQHPEAGKQRAEAMRTVWRNPVFRNRRIEGLRTSWVRRRQQQKARGGPARREG